MSDKRRSVKNEIGYRPTWAEVDLGNLEYNFRRIRKMLPAQVKVMACVKADAYGHGLVPVAKKLAGCSADCLGVASIDEGIKLRRAGIRTPVLVLGVPLKKDIAPFFDFNITPTVCDYGFARALNRMGAHRHRKINVHLKIDTGMGRLGVLSRESAGLIRKIARLKFIRLQGVFTHLSSADIDPAFTLHQIGLFASVISSLDKEGIGVDYKHTANSMGLAAYPSSHFNMVRPGLILYGLYPRSSMKIKLKPVLSLKTRVVYIKKVPKGYGISYSRQYITRKETRIAVLPIGYGDGYPRNLSNKGPVLIGGKAYKISGRVCMDQMMVDIGSSNVKVGEEAVLIGSQNGKYITAEGLAELSGTISYEIVCGLGSRIPRLYV